MIRGVDGHDAEAIKAAIESALQSQDKPTLVCCRTTIGFGSPGKAGKESSHGAPLGKDEVAATRAALDWPHAPFEIPDDIYAGWRARDAGLVREHQWDQLFDAYADAISGTRRRTRAPLARRTAAMGLPPARTPTSRSCRPTARSSPRARHRRWRSRPSAPLLPELIGGSADLAHSNLTLWKGSKSVAGDDADANYVYYGVREFAMTAISNGLGAARRLHSVRRDVPGLQRLRAQRGAHERVDGRARDPRLHARFDRPGRRRADAPADRTPGIAALHPATTTSGVPAMPSNRRWRGARRSNARRPVVPGVLAPEPRAPAAQRRAGRRHRTRRLRPARQRRRTRKLILIATGSEVGIAMQARRDSWATACASCRCRRPTCSTARTRHIAKRVLPNACRKRIAIEAGVTDFWRKYVGLDGAVVGIDTLRRVGAGRGADAAFRLHGRQRGRDGAIVGLTHGQCERARGKAVAARVLPARSARGRAGPPQQDSGRGRRPPCAHVETEAYCGAFDAAAHTYRGKTRAMR